MRRWFTFILPIIVAVLMIGCAPDRASVTETAPTIEPPMLAELDVPPTVATLPEAIILPSHTLSPTATSAPHYPPTLTPQPPPIVTPLVSEVPQGRMVRIGDQSIQTIEFSPAGDALAVAYSSVILLFDADSLDLLKTIDTKSRIDDMAWSPDGTQIATGRDDGLVQLWDATTSRNMASWSIHDWLVDGLAFSPDGALLASGSDRTIVLTDVHTGQSVHMLTGHDQFVNDGSFSPDGSKLVSVSADMFLIVWDVQTGNELQRVDASFGAVVSSVEYSPEGTVFASGSWDQLTRIWDATTIKELFTLQGNPTYVTDIAFSPDGRLLATANGNDVMVWNVKTGSRVQSFPSPGETTYRVDWDPSGKYLAASLLDGSFVAWNVSYLQ